MESVKERETINGIEEIKELEKQRVLEEQEHKKEKGYITINAKFNMVLAISIA
ncbi:hypothetical protein SAMN02745196_02080 [Clostridium collagenovorans DSM 3089]|uniref:Uncharacterized protein n=1 Tax=Clostridium collagenovorans DSM 3089 TaxID=1121306 RepID=A0A1M5X7K7_9CLOT|nr:hypothetical protein [Clostridium collagenovorans]SHH95815.1 hypothetical protein SAMN02745196_02080 [Clostridium collagenovorans DSM 3089]